MLISWVGAAAAAADVMMIASRRLVTLLVRGRCCSTVDWLPVAGVGADGLLVRQRVVARVRVRVGQHASGRPA